MCVHINAQTQQPPFANLQHSPIQYNKSIEAATSKCAIFIFYYFIYYYSFFCCYNTFFLQYSFLQFFYVLLTCVLWFMPLSCFRSPTISFRFFLIFVGIKTRILSFIIIFCLFSLIHIFPFRFCFRVYITLFCATWGTIPCINIKVKRTIKNV